MNPDIAHALEIAAVVVAGTMTGNEIAVAVFFHPRISRLEDTVHVRAAQTLASALGTVMPFWYALTFALSLAATFVAHTTWSTPWWLALGAPSAAIGLFHRVDREESDRIGHLVLSRGGRHGGLLCSRFFEGPRPLGRLRLNNGRL